MNWLRRNWVGLIGWAFAAVALASGASAYHYAAQRDEQARAIPHRLQRGEADLAKQHERAVEVLSGLVDALRSVTFSFAAFAAVVAAWGARRHPNVWLIAATAVQVVAAVGLALASSA